MNLFGFHIDIASYKFIAIQAGKVVLIVAATYLVIRIIAASLRKQVSRKGVDEGLAYAIIQMSKYILIITAITLCLDVFGINIDVLLAGSAALLVGLGLGIQQIFNDVISGIILLLEGSVKVGDILESEKIVGEVKSIGLRTSEVLTRENVIMIVPNSKFVSEKVVNWTHNDLPTRFMIEVGVAYGSDAKIIQAILKECALENPDVETEEVMAPYTRLVNFGDSSLAFELYFFSLNMFRIENVKSDIRCRIYEKFNEQGIVFPFPQRDVHMIGATTSSTSGQ